jgi:hypothetical protein
VAVVVVDNLPYAPPLDMVGADPTITIPSVIITKGDGYVIKSLLRRHSIVNVTMLLDLSIRAGADPADRALLYASNPVEPGSSISHWEAIASPNQIMEPYLNPHEPHVVIPPADMTLPLLRDIGWFLDENLDGRADTTVMVGQCNSGVPNANVIPGVTIADQVKACAANPSTHSRYVSCVSKTLNAVSRAGIITVKQQAAIQTCANNASIP